MIWLAWFNSAVRLVCCAEIRLFSFEISAFSVDSMLLLEFAASARIPVDELVPALFSMLEKFCPQLLAFWKKPTTLAIVGVQQGIERVGVEGERAVVVHADAEAVRLLMSDELL